MQCLVNLHSVSLSSKAQNKTVSNALNLANYPLCNIWFLNCKYISFESLFVTGWVCTGCFCLHIRELDEICSMEVQPLRQPLHEVIALVSGEGAEGETHRQLGITFGGLYPYKIHAAIQVLKCYFFREILPQFIPTNGSLHTSKSFGCLNGCTAHMCTTADAHTGTCKHKKTHKALCQGKRDQLPLQAR